jgi:hypothetical protein
MTDNYSTGAGTVQLPPSAGVSLRIGAAVWGTSFLCKHTVIQVNPNFMYLRNRKGRIKNISLQYFFFTMHYL